VKSVSRGTTGKKRDVEREQKRRMMGERRGEEKRKKKKKKEKKKNDLKNLLLPLKYDWFVHKLEHPPSLIQIVE
jgi:hypothetical protein